MKTDTQIFTQFYCCKCNTSVDWVRIGDAWVKSIFIVKPDPQSHQIDYKHECLSCIKSNFSYNFTV